MSNLFSRLPPVPTGPIVIPPAPSPFILKDVLGVMHRKMTESQFFELLNDFAGHLRGRELRMGAGGGIGSTMNAYARARGKITTAAQAIAFIKWLTEPSTLAAMKITELGLIHELYNVYYEAGSEMSARLAKLKYRGGKRRATRHLRSKRRSTRSRRSSN
jgi:hypothetical protein